MPYSFLVIGDNGTGKSTFGLSGEGVVDHHGFDPGSYERASAGMPDQNGRIISHEYNPPLTNLERPTKTSLVNPAVPMSAHKLSGWSEMFWDFVDQYLEGIKGQGYPVIDTETKMWLCIRQGFLQEVQEASGTEKERLNTLAYTEPNARYDQIIAAPKIFKKNLVMIAHEKEQWFNDKPTGIFVHDGRKEAPNLADCTLRFVLKNKRPVATIMKAGAGGLDLLGMEIPAPTLPQMCHLLDSAAMIRRKGMAVPGTYADLIATAEALAE